jgi:hypothetical protein
MAEIWPAYKDGTPADIRHRVKGKAVDGREVEGVTVAANIEVGKKRNIRVKEADGTIEYHDAKDFEFLGPA